MEKQQESKLAYGLKKTGKVLWWLSGGKMIVTSVKQAGHHAEESFGRMRTLVDVLKEKLRRKPMRNETFSEAVIIHQLTPEVLAEKRKQCAQMLLLVTPLFPLALYYLTYHLALGHIFAVFASLASLSLSGTIIFRNALLIWQIDKRYLGTPSEFMWSYEWVPGSVKKEQK